LLLLPALNLLENNDRANVMVLFNKSSYLPLTILLITLLALIL
jgi:hypothetical protein